MSGAISTGGTRGRGSANQDFDLNIASIIDCFTVLIAFMLASAAFLSIGILDAGIAAGGTESTGTTPPPINITVELKKDRAIAIRTIGKESRSESISSKAGMWDYEGMARQLTSIKSRYPAVNAVTLAADQDVEYKNVVEAMQHARKSLPVVLLGGF